MARVAQALLVFLLGCWVAAGPAAGAAARPPNVVLIFLDDSGWGDFHPFGNPAYPTPHVERLAAEGCRFDRFYVPQAICSASRAALLTGCYPERTRLFGAHPPEARGLDPKYATMSEVLKARGYATAVFGKWHIGDRPETRPWARGFDESCGLMYSHDMWEYHPENPKYWGKWPLRFWHNGQVTIERVTPAHQPLLTAWYTEHAVDFIQRHAHEPFFLYVPHSMPHVPLACREVFRGKSGAGLYGDVIMELDWSVGQINQALKSAGVETNTLVILTSDNGPWISYGNHAGTTPFREAKGTSFDGGVRSACLMKLPGRIPAGSRSERALSTIDLLPTIAHLAGAPLPSNPVDGRNAWDLIRGHPEAQPVHDYYPFTTGGTFEGVISGDGRWKLHLPHGYRTLVAPGKDGAAGKYQAVKIERSLFDLVNDPLERTNVWDQHPEIGARLQALADQHRARFYGQP